MYFHDEGERLVALPAAWTDLLPPDPFVVVAKGRSAFRANDLWELVQLLRRVSLFQAKADLVALMVDSASDSPLQFGEPSLPWNRRLQKWAHRCLDIYTKHPWFLEATSSREGIMGPNELSWMEAALAMLAQSGLGPKERHHAFLAIIGHVRGHATFQQIGTRANSRKEWSRELGRMLQSESHRYPILLDVVRSGGFSEDVGGAFEFGLNCILDGILVRVSRRSN